MAAKTRDSRGFVLKLPVLGVVDRKTLSHNGMLAGLRTVLRPRTKEPFLLLFTERSLAKRYLRARALTGSLVVPLEPVGVLRALLVAFARTGIRWAAVDSPTTTGHKWRPVAISRIIAAIDAVPRRRR
jgi:hypothetical protein